MRKLPAWTHRFVMPLFLTCFMTVIVSGISTVRVTGLDAHFFEHWFGSWLWSWLVAYPVLLCVLPVVHWLVGKVVERG